MSSRRIEVLSTYVYRVHLTGQTVCNGDTELMGRLFTNDSIVRWHFESFRRKWRGIENVQPDPGMPPVVVFHHPRDMEAWLSQTRPRDAKASA